MLIHERRLYAQGFKMIAGIDEVGRGCWAGPVVAAAVILDPVLLATAHTALIRDSKQLSAQQRSLAIDQIKALALGIGIGAVAAHWIDLYGIAEATRIAMYQAILALPNIPEALLIDWVRLPQLALPQHSFPKGDQHSLSIAAASIIAKVHRDTIMQTYGAYDSRYGWEKHKGYGTKIHRDALQNHGPSSLHRHSFKPVMHHLYA